jgi:hypothetical protein
MKGSSKQVMKNTKKVGTSGIEHDGGLKNTKALKKLVIHKDGIRKEKYMGRLQTGHLASCIHKRARDL